MTSITTKSSSLMSVTALIIFLVLFLFSYSGVHASDVSRDDSNDDVSTPLDTIGIPDNEAAQIADDIAEAVFENIFAPVGISKEKLRSVLSVAGGIDGGQQRRRLQELSLNLGGGLNELVEIIEGVVPVGRDDVKTARQSIDNVTDPIRVPDRLNDFLKEWSLLDINNFGIDDADADFLTRLTKTLTSLASPSGVGKRRLSAESDNEKVEAEERRLNRLDYAPAGADYMDQIQAFLKLTSMEKWVDLFTGSTNPLTTISTFNTVKGAAMGDESVSPFALEDVMRDVAQFSDFFGLLNPEVMAEKLGANGGDVLSSFLSEVSSSPQRFVPPPMPGLEMFLSGSSPPLSGFFSPEKIGAFLAEIFANSIDLRGSENGKLTPEIMSHFVPEEMREVADKMGFNPARGFEMIPSLSLFSSLPQGLDVGMLMDPLAAATGGIGASDSLGVLGSLLDFGATLSERSADGPLDAFMSQENELPFVAGSQKLSSTVAGSLF